MPIKILPLSNPGEDKKYIDALMALVKRAQANNASPYMYPNGRDFYADNLAGATINVLATDENRLVAYAALRRMSPWPAYLDRPDVQPEHCALMLLNLVDPEYRGRGIGQQLASARITAARAHGFKHLFATVHPDNIASNQVLERQGFHRVAQQPMFSERLLRNLMRLDLTD
ncbi:N-acetyltransferase family protein [Endozoicomonadaceae bacterium StTr2]